MTQDMNGAQTELKLYETRDLDIWGHASKTQASRPCRNGHSVTTHTVIASQIGWIDQKGRVYPNDFTLPKPFDGGSITPLLVQKDCD